jgi:hypothetical protein
MGLFGPSIRIGHIRGAGNGFFFFGPFAKINKLALFTAKRTKSTFFAPLYASFAGRTLDDRNVIHSVFLIRFFRRLILACFVEARRAGSHPFKRKLTAY